MSEQTDALEPEGTEAAESAETAQAAVDTDGSSPPWGDDFDADRAWKTITSQREEAKELKERLRQEQAIWENEQAVAARAAEKFQWQLEQGEDEPDDEELADDEPVDPRVEAHDQWIRSQQEKQALKDFNEDLDSAASETEVKLTARDRKTILAESMANGFNPDATRKALKELIEDREQLKASWQEELSTSKQTPRPPGSGKTATQVPDLDDDQQRRQWMAERLSQLNRSA